MSQWYCNIGAHNRDACRVQDVHKAGDLLDAHMRSTQGGDRSPCGTTTPIYFVALGN